MVKFAEVRHLLHIFLMEMAFEAGKTDVLRNNLTPDELKDFLEDNPGHLPKEIMQQYRMSDKDFKGFLVDVLGQWAPMLADPQGQGQKAVMSKMIAGASDTDADMTSLLIYILDHPDRKYILFCALLAVLIETPLN